MGETEALDFPVTFSLHWLGISIPSIVGPAGPKDTPTLSSKAIAMGSGFGRASPGSPTSPDSGEDSDSGSTASTAAEF